MVQHRSSKKEPKKFKSKHATKGQLKRHSQKPLTNGVSKKISTNKNSTLKKQKKIMNSLPRIIALVPLCPDISVEQVHAEVVKLNVMFPYVADVVEAELGSSNGLFGALAFAKQVD